MRQLRIVRRGKSSNGGISAESTEEKVSQSEMAQEKNSAMREKGQFERMKASLLIGVREGGGEIRVTEAVCGGHSTDFSVWVVTADWMNRDGRRVKGGRWSLGDDQKSQQLGWWVLALVLFLCPLLES